MSEEQVHKMEELDRLLNDPEVCLQPALIWALAAEIAEPRWNPGGPSDHP